MACARPKTLPVASRSWPGLHQFHIAAAAPALNADHWTTRSPAARDFAAREGRLHLVDSADSGRQQHFDGATQTLDDQAHLGIREYRLAEIQLQLTERDREPQLRRNGYAADVPCAAEETRKRGGKVRFGRL